MKTLGVALAACCAAVFWPSVAHANPFGTREAASEKTLNFVPGWQALDGDGDANAGAFTSQAGLDHSVHFASTGTTDVFNDERVSLGDVIDVDGLARAMHTEITLGLRHGDDEGDKDRDKGRDNDRDDHHGPVAPGAPTPHGPKLSDPPTGGAATTSATPEPGSMLLLATGLAGLICYRRQLFG